MPPRAYWRPKRCSAPTSRWSAGSSERTAELTRLNAELAEAKAGAEAANLSKTRFHRSGEPRHSAAAQCGAAVHLEPGRAHQAHKDGELVRNVDASLEAVEDILVGAARYLAA